MERQGQFVMPCKYLLRLFHMNILNILEVLLTIKYVYENYHSSQIFMISYFQVVDVRGCGGFGVHFYTTSSIHNAHPAVTIRATSNQ